VLVERVQEAGVRGVDAGALDGALVHRLGGAVVVDGEEVLESERLRGVGRDVPVRRVHPPDGGDVPACRRVVLDDVAAAGRPGGRRVRRQLRRVVADESPRRFRAPGVQPEVEVGVDVPHVLGVGHREPEPVQQLAQQRRQLDGVRREVERSDGGDGLPQDRVDATGVDDRERPRGASEDLVHANGDRAERAFVHVPEFVVPVGRGVDFEHHAVGVRRQRDAHGRDVGGVLDHVPRRVVQRQAPRHRDDEVGGIHRGGPRVAAEVEVERQVGVVYARQLAVDEVAEVDGERGVAGGGQERRVPGDVLGHGPDDAVRPRLGGAAAEELHAAQPDAEDAVVLGASAGGALVEDGEGDRRRCAAGRAEAPRRGVRGCGGGFGEGEPEGVGEQERRAWAGAARGRAKRPLHLEVCRRPRRVGRR
jgi:hypothetical protein